MKKINFITSPKVAKVFDAYPGKVKERMLELRQLVLDTANSIRGLNKLEETLKWGEPSYQTKHGSTIRMDWKEKTPMQYALYFQCTSRLVPTFKAVFNNTFDYEGTRAIVFKLNEELPVPELKECIKAALRYHIVKSHVTLEI